MVNLYCFFILPLFEIEINSHFISCISLPINSDFAANRNPNAAAILGKESSLRSNSKNVPDTGKNEELQRRKELAKEKALAKMKAQMANFAKMMDSSPSFDDDDNDEGRIRSSSIERSESIENNFSTPIRNRAGTTELMDVDSSRDQADIISTPLPTTPPYTPRSGTPRSRSGSCCSTPRTITQHSGIRLLDERPQCIICGTDSDMQIDSIAGATAATGEMNRDKALAFCGYAQASTVAKGGGGLPSRGGVQDSVSYMRQHVGVHVTVSMILSCYV